MAAVLPLVLAAGALTVVMVGKNIDSISPTAARRLDDLAGSARAAVSSVGTGLQAQVDADKRRFRGGAKRHEGYTTMAALAALVLACAFIP